MISIARSPRTACGIVPATFSIKFCSLTSASALKRPGTAILIVRPDIAPFPARAAFTTPCGVAQSWNCRSASAMGAGAGAHRLRHGLERGLLVLGVGGERGDEQQERGDPRERRAHA